MKTMSSSSKSRLYSKIYNTNSFQQALVLDK